MEEQVCAICKKLIGELPKATLGEKGSATINQASKVRNEAIDFTAGQQVHQECRRLYCSPTQIAKSLNKPVVDENELQGAVK